MSDILYRCGLHNPDQARAVLKTHTLPWIGEQLKQGRELTLHVRLLDDEITDRQRGYLHGVVLTEIARYARVEGRAFDMKVWKEWYRAEFLGFKTVTYTDPFTGKKLRRRVRVSTEDLGVRGMADYIDRVVAHAATVLGVVVSEPLPPELRPADRRAKAVEQGNVDPETGEVLETV